jgi:hypothetical protein
MQEIVIFGSSFGANQQSGLLRAFWWAFVGVWASVVGVWASVGFCSGKYKFTSLSILADFWRYGINATYTLH